MQQTLVVVVYRHGQGALGGILANHIVVQIGLDIGWRWQVIALELFPFLAFCRHFVAHDVVAQVDALIADEHGWACNEFLDLMLALAAERAVQGFFAG
ncbi:hypothetical protein D3C72_2152550 [compost metagenome]